MNPSEILNFIICFLLGSFMYLYFSLRIKYKKEIERYDKLYEINRDKAKYASEESLAWKRRYQSEHKKVMELVNGLQFSPNEEPKNEYEIKIMVNDKTIFKKGWRIRI